MTSVEGNGTRRVEVEFSKFYPPSVLQLRDLQVEFSGYR